MSLYLEHITQRFGQTLALNDIDLEIRHGEFLAILGPSGCGKTTLLRAIGGFAKPTEGKIRMDDVKISVDHDMVEVFVGEQVAFTYRIFRKPEYEIGLLAQDAKVEFANIAIRK